jgi:hypothetical protein
MSHDDGRASAFVGWLEEPAPLWVVAAATVCAAAFGVHAGLPLGHFAAPAIGAATAGAVIGCGARGTLGDVAVAFATCATLLTTGFGALGLDAPLEPFSAQAPGGASLLALRMGLFLVAVVRLGPRPLGPRTLLALTGLIIASLAARALVIGVALAVPVVLRFANGGGSGTTTSSERSPGTSKAAIDGRLAASAAALMAVVTGLALALGRMPGSKELGPPAAPRDATTYWLSRRNLFHAHEAALAWAKKEAPPGEAYLTLAEIDFALGHDDRGRKVLTKLRSAAASDDARRRADEIEARGTRR